METLYDLTTEDTKYYQETPEDVKKNDSLILVKPVHNTNTFEIERKDINKLTRIAGENDSIDYNHRSIKIGKSDDALVISWFWINKRSRRINYKHRFRKQSGIRRIIIKYNDNNFYVSDIGFHKKRRRKSIRQNVLKANKVVTFANVAAQHIYSTKTVNTTKEAYIEVIKILHILTTELDVPKTKSWFENEVLIKKDFFDNTSVGRSEKIIRTILVNGIIYTILEWFCGKNNIIFNELWELRLMSVQYFTKRNLKKYNNIYLDAFCDYYHIEKTPKNIDIIRIKLEKENVFAPLPQNRSVTKNKPSDKDIFYEEFDYISFITFSVYNRVFKHNPLYSNFWKYVETKQTKITYIFDLNKKDGHNRYVKFLEYLEQNSEVFSNIILYNTGSNLTMIHNNTQKVIDVERFNNFIRCLAYLYDINIMFDFTKIGDVLDNFDLFQTEVMLLIKNRGVFVIEKIAPDFKKIIEKPFQSNKEKWSVKLLSKNTTQFRQELTSADIDGSAIDDDEFDDGIPEFYKYLYSQIISGYLINEETDYTISFEISQSINSGLSVEFSQTDVINYIIKYVKETNTLSKKDIPSVCNYYNVSTYQKKIENHKGDDSYMPLLGLIHKVGKNIVTNKNKFGKESHILETPLEKLIKKHNFINKFLKIETNE